MSKLDEQLAALRESLRTADGTEAGFSRLFDTYIELTRIIELLHGSEPVEDEHLRSMIEIVVRRSANDPALAFGRMEILKYDPANLWHGAFRAGEHRGGFFYFMPERQGLVAVSAGLTANYCRITLADLPRGSSKRRKRWRS